MDSFRVFMENNQYLDGGASASGTTSTSGTRAGTTSTSGIPQSMGKNLTNDGQLLDQRITTNTANDVAFRTGAAQPFKKLEASHNALQQQVTALSAKVDGLEKTVAKQTEAMGQIITLIRELRGQ